MSHPKSKHVTSIRRSIRTALRATLAAILFTSTAVVAQEQPSAEGTPPGADDMAKMMELARPGKNHQLLAALVGTWDYQMKFWMTPGAPPVEARGTAARKPTLDGHYFIMDSAAKMQMPGPDGKMVDVPFKGMAIEGYDNVKGKFVSTWIDNMGTGIIMAEGTYDAATKTFTYHYEEEMMPGTKTRVRETIKVLDQDHHVYEWYETRGGAETKTMELACTRQR